MSNTAQKRIRITFLGFNNPFEEAIIFRKHNGELGLFKRSKRLGQLEKPPALIRRDMNGNCWVPEMSVTLYNGEYIAFATVGDKYVKIPKDILNTWRGRALEKGFISM